MICISKSDCDKYGCPNCGCSYKIHTFGDGYLDEFMCGECNTHYETVSDEIIGIVKERQILNDYLKKHDDNEVREIINEHKPTAVFETFKSVVASCIPHPRIGILKHELSITDIKSR